VTIPGMGDDIQAIKAGILETGDIFVINKADREGAEKTLADLRLMIDMDQKKHEQGGWVPPILKVEAVFDKGVAEFLEEIEKHRRYLSESVATLRFGRKTKMLREELADMVRNRIVQEVFDRLESSGEFEEAVAAVLSGEIDPYSACDNLVLSRLRLDRDVPVKENVRVSREEKAE